MNKIRHCLVLMLLLLASAMQAHAGVVEYRKQPAWTLENYLTHFLVKVPMAQAKPVGAGVELSGEIVIKFQNMPDDLKKSVQLELMKAFAGERAISGAFIDASRAQISFGNGLALLDAEEYFTPTPEPIAVETKPLDSREAEEVRRQVEDRQRWEAQSQMGCGQFLLNIDK